MLDVSWNSLVPKAMKKLLEKIAENRKLENINLSFNQIADHKTTEKEELKLAVYTTTAIKRNKKLMHLDLSCTGLSPLIVKEIGNAMRRARSLLSIHLSDNPGLTKANLEYLPARLKFRPNEDMQRFHRIQSFLKDKYEADLKEGIVWKMTKQVSFHKRKVEPMDKMVLQRIIGFRGEQPGVGQWFETSRRTCQDQKHYKSECWVCEKHIYSVLLWSRGRAYLMQPILNENEAEELCYQIDQVSGTPSEPGIGYVDGEVGRTPIIAASFTGWRYKQMTPLHEWT